MVTLQKITEIYDKNLANKTLIFDVRHKNTPFKIKFDQNNLGHLLGLQYFGYTRMEQRYKDLLEGKITWSILEKKNLGAYKEHFFRMSYFQYILQVLDQPLIAIPRKDNTSIKADFMFYSKEENRYLSLGIIRSKSPKETIYYPETFIESKNNKWEKERHIILKPKK